VPRAGHQRFVADSLRELLDWQQVAHRKALGAAKNSRLKMQAIKKAGARPAFSSMWLTPKSVPDLST
jgi:hypothetical protein